MADRKGSARHRPQTLKIDDQKSKAHKMDVEVENTSTDRWKHFQTCIRKRDSEECVVRQSRSSQRSTSVTREDIFAPHFVQLPSKPQNRMDIIERKALYKTVNRRPCVDTTESKTVVQSPQNSPSGLDKQSVSRYSDKVIDSKGVTQVGEGNTIIYNTYHINNKHYHKHRHYHKSTQHHGNCAFFHVPCHCQDCLLYHQKDHPPLAENQHPHSEHGHLTLPQHSVPQLRPCSLQTKQMESARKREPMPVDTRCNQPKQETTGPKSSQCPVVGDVTPNLTLVRPTELNQAEILLTETCQNEENTTKESKSAETRPVLHDEVIQEITIIDNEGMELMPGDSVCIESPNWRSAIYVGNQRIVVCNEDAGGSLVVEEEELKLALPFRRSSSCEGCPLSSPGERVKRAQSQVGTRFTRGDTWDFFSWVMTGMTLDQVVDNTD